ncbi:Sulfate permease 2 [Nakaseomyces bracarensis]|uniref:Sulfate permease 2 n=1 Tax=Nakaseomyces bracarensis TaxID=273131 RepID=A0ABR4NX74_9SACH
MEELDNLELEYNQFKSTENTSGQNNTNIDSTNNHNNINNINNRGYSNNYEENDLDKTFTLEKGIENNSPYSNGSDIDRYSIPGYNEEKVTLKDYYDHELKHYTTWGAARDYFVSMFPIVRWLPHYNPKWFLSDLIAGITVGTVLVPQSMSYAQIATLPPEYGLYSSFVGAMVYSFFATSKDVCIGPVAVMSLQTAKVIAHVQHKHPDLVNVYTAPIIATALAFLCGVISLGVGLLRLGFLVELISFNAVAGFMTGSAFNIMWGQVPGLMGYSKKVNTRRATFHVVIDTLKHLPDTKLDAAFGLIPLFTLYFWKWWCGSMGPKLVDRYYPANKYPRVNKYWKTFYFYFVTSRNGILIILFTAVSYGITKGVPKDKHRISVLGKVPKGLKHVGVMRIPHGLLRHMAEELPSSIIVLLLEHIAISKSFGRVNDYKIVPDQEIIAIGATNLLGTFFNAYPATGSFSRSALKAKCNVMTPLSGLFSAACVLLAVYCLTGAFYYIPKATLSAVIIHAVSDLIASYHATWAFWKMNPFDFIGFLTTVIITVFSSIENGIYFAMCWSCAVLLYKNAFPAGKFLGRIEIAEVVNPKITDDESASLDDSFDEDLGYFENINEDKLGNSSNDVKKFNGDIKTRNITGSSNSLTNRSQKIKYYTKWVPFDHSYSRELNPSVRIQPPPPGVIVYRLGDSYTYINCSRHYDIIFDEVKRLTKRGQLMQHKHKWDRPWNDPGEWEVPNFSKWLKPKKFIETFTKKVVDVDNSHDENDIEHMNVPERTVKNTKDDRPLLKVVCLDFSQVAHIDATALQSLIDLRKAINKYADRQVEFHIVGVYSAWIKRGLINIGFGTTNEEYSDESIIAGHASYHVTKFTDTGSDTFEELESLESQRISVSNKVKVLPASGTNLPFFHIDIPDFSKWDI